MSRTNTAATAAAPVQTTDTGLQILDVTRMTPEQATDAMIARAVTMPASDLFFVNNEQHVAANVRYLGIIRPLAIMSNDQGRRVMSHVKAMAGMDLTPARHPVDGRWIYRGEEESDGADLRINVIPTIYGEDFAIRILSRNTRLFALENLGFLPQQLPAYQNMIASPSGLILITGPTGSGKTATLYASLVRLNDGQRKINTIEDPVEYTISGLRQSQINPNVNLTFAEMLRGILRQSPDVIMIGEIRDEETAKIAVQAANSGVVVLATIHAPTAAGAIQSMRSLGVHSHFLATGLRGVVSQRLVRTLDPTTRTKFELGDDTDTFADVAKWLGPNEGKVLYAPVPAPSNQMTGYSALTGVFEVMPITKTLRNMISDGKPTRDIRHQAVQEGMIEFRQAALLKVARGETSTEEVFRVIPSEHLIMEE